MKMAMRKIGGVCSPVPKNRGIIDLSNSNQSTIKWFSPSHSHSKRISRPIFCLARGLSTLLPSPTKQLPKKKHEVSKELLDAYSSMGTDTLEGTIEKMIYSCRFMAFLGIIGSLMGSVICFLKGCVYVVNSFTEHYFLSGSQVISTLVEAIDIYLIGTVMLVFGMGLYELFISNMDIAKSSSHGSNLLGLFRLPARPQWLEIKSVNELKTKLGHVIVMVLLIGLFEKSKKVAIHTTTDLFCFAASILLSSGCLLLLSKLQNHNPSNHASSNTT